MALLLLALAAAGDAVGQPTPDSLLSAINADIRDGVWFERGYVVLTPELALTADNQLQLKAVACRSPGNPDAAFIASCRSGDAADLARTTVTIDPRGWTRAPSGSAPEPAPIRWPSPVAPARLA